MPDVHPTNLFVPPPETYRLSQLVLDALTTPVCVLDETGRIMAVNSAWRAFSELNSGCAWTREPALAGVNYLDVCDAAAAHGSTSASAFADGLRLVIGGRRLAYSQEYDCHSPDRQRWFVGRVTRTSDGGRMRLVVAHEDVTERRLAEIALQESNRDLESRVMQRTAEMAAVNARLRQEVAERETAERHLARYRALAEHSRDIMLFVGYPDGRILEANAAACAAYGRTRAEMLTLHIKVFRAAENHADVVRQMEQANRSGVLFETVHRRADGTTFPVEVSSRGVDYTGDRVLLSIVRDITERKKAEAERDALIAQLQESLANVRTLSGFIPICSGCRKIRDDEGFWSNVETYVRAHTDAQLTHGMCPECLRRWYPGMTEDPS